MILAISFYDLIFIDNIPPLKHNDSSESFLMNDPVASRLGIRQNLLIKNRSKLRVMKPTGGN